MRAMTLRLAAAALALSASVGLAGCGDDLDSDQQARLAYIGLDKSIQKSLQLGFDGFNAASSANIPAQTTNGAVSGTLTITGQVDQGSSANKGMRLKVGLVQYSDGKATLPNDEGEAEITYSTSSDVASQPALDLSLRDIPNGTFSGTLVGPFNMAGDIEGVATLSLTFAGQIEDDGTGKVRRKAGTTTVTGTATSGDGTYQVNVSL